MQKTGNELTYDYDFYALNGLLSFLLIFTAVLLVANMLCQRPKRASFISTLELLATINVLTISVNALNGLLSFLPTCVRVISRPTSCVNALNGLLSFLQLVAVITPKVAGRCQRPKRASFISTN